MPSKIISIGFNVDIDSVQTNIVIVEVSGTGKDAYEITRILKDNQILVLPFSSVKIRLVTYLNLTLRDIDNAIGILRKLFE